MDLRPNLTVNRTSRFILSFSSATGPRAVTSNVRRHETFSARRRGYETMYAIKTEVARPNDRAWVFSGQKTMCGGKKIAVGDQVFIFASENEGGVGLIALGTVTAARAVARKAGVERQTPRVSISIIRTRTARRRLGRTELKPFEDWSDGRPETELNFKFYRQATNKIVGLSEAAAAFLRSFF